MTTITTRAGKGSPLTNTEVDSNFTNLNNDKLETSAYTAADVLTKVKTVDGAGSGLDADTLDGLQATAFATAAQGATADAALPNVGTRPTIRPSLLLDFANSKTVDERITFTRSTTATYYDAQGVLKYAQPDQPRIDHDPVTGECKGLLIEEQRANMLNNSSDIVASGSWSVNNCLRPIRASVISPSGLMDAYKIMENNNFSRHETSFTAFPFVNGVTYVATVYAKAAERNYLELAFGGYPSAGFNLLTGEASPNGPQVSGYPKMTHVGNGWYKCEFARLSTVDQADMALYMGIEQAFGGFASNQGVFGYGLYIWGAQVEVGSFSTSYIPSKTTFTSRASSATYFDSTGVLRTAGVNQPRYGYGYDSASGKWVSQGLVLESAATNILVGSDLYGNTLNYEAVYTKTNNSTDVVAPNGSGLTTKLVTGTTGNTWYWRIPSAGTFTNGVTYTISVWVRCAAGTTATWNLQPYPYNANTLCNITDKWQRFSVTFTMTSETQPYIGFVSPTASRTFYVWGWQAEVGSVATSYIPTYGATATRAADVSSSAATTRVVDKAVVYGIEPLLHKSEGTVFAHYESSGYGVWELLPYSGTGGVDQRTTYAYWNDNYATYAGAFAAGVYTKTAQAYQNFNSVVVRDSVVTGTDNVHSFVVPYNRLVIGNIDLNFNYPLNGHIKKISYYPKRLSNTELQALTA